MMTCQLCSCLVIDYEKVNDDHKIPLPFQVKEVYPGLLQLTRNAEDGCDFCRLLVELLSEYFDTTARSIERPVQLQLTNAQFFLESAWVSVDEEGLYQMRKRNSAFLLTLDLLYGEPCQSMELLFRVCSDNIGEVAETMSKTSNSIAMANLFAILDKWDPSQYPMRRRLRRPVEENPLSASSISKMKDFINDCLENHEMCNVSDNDFVPTRLLSVRDGIVLQHVQGAARVPYIAFSHCWGVPTAEKPMLKTTRDSIDHRMTDIPMHILPRNFQDAVKLTRALGYEYLWIDALCIIQDCLHDWGHESARMADVYKHAIATVVSAAGKSCYDGFLDLRTLRSARIPYVRPTDNTIDGHLLLQFTDDHSMHSDYELQPSHWNRRGWTLQEHVLSRRLLFFTPRRTYFECKTANVIKSEDDEGPQVTLYNFDPCSWALRDTKSDPEGSYSHRGSEEDSDSATSNSDNISTDSDDLEILQDSSLSYPPSLDSEDCEAGDADDGYEGLERISASRWYTDYEIFIGWYHIISMYSHRTLSYGDDKFPAVEGLAREMATHANVGRYLAGLWENDLALGLLWGVGGSRSIEVAMDPSIDFWPPSHTGTFSPVGLYYEMKELPVTVPRSYRAPSWSWASFDGWTIWPEFPQFTTNGVADRIIELLNGAIELLDVQIEYEGASVYGRIADARLTLKARYCEVSCVSPPAPEQFAHRVHNGAGFFAYAFLDTDTVPPGPLHVMKTVNQPPGYGEQGYFTSGLILQSAEDRPGCFRRVGTFCLKEDHLDVFESIPPEPITLV